MDLNRLRAFAEVHRASSFSVAAKRLGIPRSTVSRSITALEEDAGVRLFQRTTRSVSTTPAGLALFERIGPSLASIERSMADLPESLAGPSGLLRVTTTVDLGTALVAPVVARFSARHPDVRVDVRLGGAVVDLVKDRIDVAVRFAAGKLPSSSLVARRLGSVGFQLYASPSYVARRGLPRTEADLASFDVVGLPGTRPAGRTTCDDKLFARELLRSGGGIGYLPTYLADRDVAEGLLVRVLPSHVIASGAVYLVQPTQKLVPQRTQLFCDALVEHVRQHPLA